MAYLDKEKELRCVGRVHHDRLLAGDGTYQHEGDLFLFSVPGARGQDEGEVGGGHGWLRTQNGVIRGAWGGW